ncbi:MAG: glycoside hydrolase family 38 C-terminal domain-containing protein [Chloroflexota bacterium]
MDMNRDARETMTRWRTKQKNAERRIINFSERVNLRLEALQERMATQRHAIPDWEIKQVYYRDVGVYEDIDSDFRPITVGESWGGPDVSAFFRREVTIPEAMDEQRVFLRIYVGGDSLLRLDGVPHHGLDPFRNVVLLTDSAKGGATHSIELESYIYWYPSESNYNVFRAAELVTIDAEVEAAYWDFVAAFKVLFMENIDDSLKHFIETHLLEALLHIPIHEPNFEVFKAQVLDIQTKFRTAVYETDRFKTSGLLHMVGHSHLDIVYQWTHREYIRKVGRTHATMLRLMEQYPEFKFSQSSCKIYSDMKEYYPNIFEQVKQRIAEGRWQPVGAFWLEPDCNLISGESFVRHILHGQRFWQEEFGFVSKVCWQPDVFGMSWALPQILHRSGIEVILSNKFFVWNDTNPWRQNTFWWEGPDGSKVLTVIPPGHFIGMVDPDHMHKYWHDFSDKETIGEMIYTYGWGDGGGGVDPEMVECAMRYGDFPGMVPTQFNHPEDTLLSIAEKAKKTDLPTWNDELYLETHRGTYTTKGRLKKLNRQSEILLRQIEMLATFAWLQTGEYPEEHLDKAWKTMLNTQFHDALPGTHITEVYHYLLDEYQCLRDEAETVINQVTPALFGANTGNQLLVFNPTLTEIEGIIALPASLLDGVLASKKAISLPYQKINGYEEREILFQLEKKIPPLAYTIFELEPSFESHDSNDVWAEDYALENRYLRAEFNDKGELTSLWDKEAKRQVLADGERGNRFQLYEDRPGKYDAWDIVASYTEQELPIIGDFSIAVSENGPLRASLTWNRDCYASHIWQRISLYADSRQLVFETVIDWQERQKLLKVGFPVDLNARHATYDIAYGNIERATHRNTPYDAAKFEVPAHWWMDMSESGYGVALLNDCKYGHEGHNEWMRLTLLKGSISPDPEADRETHHFTYALYPHIGGWREADVIGVATRFNTPLYAQRTSKSPNTHSFLHCDAPNITVEAVKRSEDGDALIVRLVEQHNQRTHATLTFDRSFSSIHRCDLMERHEEKIEINGNQVQIAFHPREIVTLALKP